MNIIPVNVGSQLVSNSNIPSAALPDGYTPYCENCIMTPGMVQKRYGISEVYSWGTGDVIRGFFRADNSHSIIAVFDYSDDKTWLYEWNNDVSSPVMRKMDLDGASQSGSDADSNWHFCRHFDSNVSGTNNQGVVICQNGYESLYYDPNAAEGSRLNTLDVKVQGKYPASFQGALYLGYVRDFGTWYPYMLAKSKNDDASDWTSYESETRPERSQEANSSVISGLASFKEGMLILFKEDSVWPVVPYLSFQQPYFINEGLTSEYGYVVTRDNVLFNSNGKIMNLAGEFLSYKINNLFASKGGELSYSAIQDLFLDKYMFAADSYMYLMDRNKDNWTQWVFNNNIRLFSNIPAFNREVDQIIGDVSKHIVMTIDEEMITPDYVISYNNKTLAVMNHFCEDFDKSIKIVYDTPWLSLGRPDRKKHITHFMANGTPSSTAKVYVATSDYPTKEMPTYVETDMPMVFNSDGYGRCALDNLGTWVSFRITEESTSPFIFTGMFVESSIRESGLYNN